MIVRTSPLTSSSSYALQRNAIKPRDAPADVSMTNGTFFSFVSSSWMESDFVGAGELAERLNISRGTLDNWRKAGKIIALRKGLRNFVYPLRQFERRRPVEGLDLVAAIFASPEEAWEWLVAPNRMTDGKPPIEVLRDGNVPAVTSAAEGAFDYA